MILPTAKNEKKIVKYLKFITEFSLVAFHERVKKNPSRNITFSRCSAFAFYENSFPFAILLFVFWIVGIF